MANRGKHVANRNWDRYLKIEIVGQIDEDTVEHVRTSLLNVEQYDGIIIRIHSQGGSLPCAIKIIADLKATSKELVMINDGMVMSVAVAIFEEGDQRFAMPFSQILIHNGQYVLDNGELAALLDGDDWPIKLLRDLHIRIRQRLAVRTGLSEEDIKEFSNQQKSIYAHEALELNLIDAILEDFRLP